MTRKKIIIILIIILSFSIFAVNISPTKSFAQNNKKGILSKFDSTFQTFREKVFVVSDKLAKEYSKIAPSTKNIPLKSGQSTPLMFLPEQPPFGKDTYRDGLQIVALYEGAYIKEVAKSIDPLLTAEDNFEFWDSFQTDVRAVFDSISERYKDLPEAEWPIIVIPTPNFQSINSIIANEYPEPNGLNVVMPYRTALGGTFPNTLNLTGNFKVTLVGGGYELNDWTRGNKLDFIDSVDIQYVDPEPHTNYDISQITVSGNTTRIYNPVIPYHVRVGWIVWLNLKGSSGNVLQRYNITEVSTTGGYITVNSPINIGNFISGTAHVNYLSGTVGVAAAKLKQIMKSLDCTFPQAVEFAKATATNQGIRNDEIGFGKIDVASAVKYGQRRMSNQNGE